MSLSQILVSALIIIVAGPGLVKIASFFVPQFVSLRAIPGPPRAHWFWGDFTQVGNDDVSPVHEKWVAKYGSTFKFYGILNVSTDRKIPFNSIA